MKTVDKALTVLDQFSFTNKEIGLSEMARMSGLDKAATRRLLVALIEHNFIEQSQETKRYRLGHGFLRLARIREATVPVSHIAQDVVSRLVDQTNETAHVGIPGPSGMTTIAHKLPNRGRVVIVLPAEVLNYHATASGLVFLAFASDVTATRIMDLKREKITPNTITSKAEVLRLTKEFRAQGYAKVSNMFEQDVSSIAMPFYSEAGDPTGTIAIALPTDEMTPARCDVLLPQLRNAVREIEMALTGL
ncbi:IclR family transcriptional regulator [uncultured Sulfitobacter sp.]|uniref:IclR family transcriptional regulator n=1 Tax=uncultured Sulfitobacter sp. TaxID=191468 RepID=UPI002601AEAD|nr:IclR family transcriptional regulator [uncultured Sulfitobacter sp.]